MTDGSSSAILERSFGEVHCAVNVPAGAGSAISVHTPSDVRATNIGPPQGFSFWIGDAPLSWLKRRIYSLKSGLGAYNSPTDKHLI